MSQVKVNFQTNDDASFKIGFNDNQRYLNNGEIVFPKNSLGYIVDESELITLVKPCGDPYISFKITDTQFANLAAFEDWFIENAVSTGGGGIDPETLAELVSSAEYVSSSSTIDFKNVDGEVISTINAEPFITDGMVDNVQISGSNLVITFNVDAGKQPISIPLSSIFDPSNYYDKSATDALLSGKADTTLVNAIAGQVATKVAISTYNTYTANTNTALSGKADTSAVTAAIDAAKAYYIDFGVLTTQGIHDADWDGMVAAINAHRPIYVGVPGANGLLYYTAECLYQDGSNIIRMTASDNSAHYFYTFTKNGSEDYSFSYQTRPYTTDAEKAAWNAKQDTLIAGSGITISGNVISADGGGGGGMSEDDELLLATALVDLNDRKMDITDAKAEFAKYQKKGDYVTSGQLDTKLAAYETALDEQNVEEVTSYALNDLNARLTTVETALGGLSLSAITQSQWATISGSANPSTIYIITNNE